MTWTPITEAEMAMARHVVTWIRTARAAGYDSDWLPTDADISKSALLERLRSGKKPLPEPPPVGLSCPWYALVEDAGPHYVFDVHRGKYGETFGHDTLFALQHPYRIVQENKAEIDFTVCDGARDTSYRFRVWYDAEWRHPSGRIVGGWFIQNVAPPNPSRSGQ